MQGDFSEGYQSTTRRNLAIAKEVGDRAGEGKAYANLGIAYFLAGGLFQGDRVPHAGPGDCKRGGGPGGGGQGVREPGATRTWFAGGLSEGYKGYRVPHAGPGDCKGGGQPGPSPLFLACQGPCPRTLGFPCTLSRLGDFSNRRIRYVEHAPADGCSCRWYAILQDPQSVLLHRAGEGMAYGNLGNAYDSLGDFATRISRRGAMQRIIEYHTRNLAIAKEVGDRAGEGRAYGNLGNAYWFAGGLQPRLSSTTRSDLAIAKEVGDRAGEGRAYANLGCVHQSQGDFSQAIKYHTQHLAIAKEVGDRAGEGSAYGHLGILPHALERVRQSRRLLGSTTCLGNNAEACTLAVRGSAQRGCRPHP